MNEVKTVQIRSVLHDEPVRNLTRTSLYVPYKGKIMAYSMSTKIAKNCANRHTRAILQTHLGLEASQVPQFNLTVNIIDREVDLILSLPLCTGTQAVDLAQFNLFKSPMFPNMTIMRNEYDQTYSIAGRLGGTYADYHHPSPALARPMVVTQNVIDKIKAINKQAIPLQVTLQTLVDQVRTHHQHDVILNQFLSNLRQNLVFNTTLDQSRTVEKCENTMQFYALSVFHVDTPDVVCE